MKTLRLIGMAIFAMFVTMNLASCSKDDDGEGGDSSSESKRLVKIEVSWVGYDDRCDWTFTYNDNGQLKSLFDNVDNSLYSSFDWQESTIVASDGTITLNSDNKVTYHDYTGSGYKGNYSYGYDSNGRMTKCTQHTSGYTSDSTSDLTWDGDKLTNIETTKSSGVKFATTLRYGNQTCKGWLPADFFTWIDDNFFRANEGGLLASAHPDLFGFKTNMLPESYSLSRFFSDGSLYKETNATISYTFTTDGYIESIFVSEEDLIMNFTWE